MKVSYNKIQFTKISVLVIFLILELINIWTLSSLYFTISYWMFIGWSITNDIMYMNSDQYHDEVDIIDYLLCNTQVTKNKSQ